VRAFRDAVETRDFGAIETLLADDVVFVSPVAFSPYAGKAITLAILRTVIDVFEGFRYVRDIGSDGAADQALVFEATVDGKRLTGCDFLHLDEAGRIDELMVMVRPLSAAVALSEQMGARFDRVRELAAEYDAAR
jgi:limonene-1,2-epoxide hydrolase